MGHERVGVLPRSRPWRAVVAGISDFSVSGDVAGLAERTLGNVRTRLDRIHEDPGVNAAFEFLVGLSATGGTPSAHSEWADLPIDGATNLRLARALREWSSERNGSLEYTTLAQAAASDAIAAWTSTHRQQGNLFGDAATSGAVWQQAATGAGFCELSRLFFAKFTERYLNYFLEREASAVLPTVGDRERFEVRMSEHVDEVSRHAFETAKITQSFAAGWFNRNARNARPSPQQIQGFLAHAFGKVREELLREGKRP
jgi:hypothetical protein